jgi:GNAT superfamily N-acetyltransferase
MIRRDMPDVMGIELASFEYAWTEDDFLRCLRQRNCIGMVAERGDSVIGFMIYELHRTRLHLLNFAVHPGARRTGIGGLMVHKLIYKLCSHRRQKISLAVREGGILVDPTAPGTVEDVKVLKDRIADLEKELKALKTQTSLKPSVGTPPEVKPKGIVRIVNEYPVEIAMLINNNPQTYRVAPGTKLDVEVPAGEFSYQLLQSGVPATKSIIKDKETVTLRIK